MVGGGQTVCFFLMMINNSCNVKMPVGGKLLSYDYKTDPGVDISIYNKNKVIYLSTVLSYA